MVDEERNEILYNLFSRAYVEIGFMEQDPIVKETLDYIKNNPELYPIWEKAAEDNKYKKYFSNLKSRRVTFKFWGIKFSLYYTNELLFSNDRFYVIEYHPTNKLLKYLLNFV